jgi:glycosyltransferase involved in cell wall biosynthesis
LEAARELRDLNASFEIIGTGPDRILLSRFIAEHNLSEHVKILDYQPDWWSKLVDCRALISTSIYEGQPNVVLEAMSAKCPVILSSIEAHREIATEASALFFETGNSESLATAIRLACQVNEDLFNRAESAFNKLGDRSPAQIASLYNEVYQTSIWCSK